MLGLVPGAALGASAAGFTSVDVGIDGSGHCKNGGPDVVNCNIYDGKQYVWMNGGPAAAALGDGSYFFAVLEPGAQADPNDGTTGNLSSVYDTYTNRTFTISGSTFTYGGSHDLDGGKIRLMQYADTTNPGSVYILAICSLANYPVDPSSCKYDAFKVETGASTQGQPLTIVKDASGAYTNTYAWDIQKAVDKTEIDQSGTQATFNYTVTVSHNGGTVSNVKVTGTITVFNPNVGDVTGVNVTDRLSDGTECTVTNGTGATVSTGDNTFAYECLLSDRPQGELDNTASVAWDTQTIDDGDLPGGSADFTFTNVSFTGNAIDDCVTVTDTFNSGTLMTLGVACQDGTFTKDAGNTLTGFASSYTAPTFTFTYSRTVTGTAGTCTSFDNTALFTTNTTGKTSDPADATVKLCVGQDLTVTKTATPAFKRTYTWDIGKAVDKTLVEQIGGTATFNYQVDAKETGFGDSDWVVTGKVTVTNPNDWESITADLSDAVNNGGTCILDQNSVTVAASSHEDVGYRCTFASGDPGTNTATATWDKDAYSTPTGSASGTASFAFTTPTATVNGTVTITDTFNGVTTTLGTLAATDVAPFASASYKYQHTVNVPANNCVTYTNTAKIVETGQSVSKTVEVCGPAKTGALTMGFWQNKNGQGIITSGASVSNVCKSGTWLRQYAPFQDLSVTATCAQVGTYVTNIIKAANASGSSMNAMLKAQMLATALDVYFSDPALGTNKIGAPAPIGGVVIDLTKICHMIDGSGGTATCSGSYENVSSAFGGASSLSVSAMLTYAASQSNLGGISWYGQVKATQGLAKDAFDAINNQVAFAP